MNRRMRSAVTLGTLCVVAVITACTSREDAANAANAANAARKVDPNLPAVVQGPPIIIPSDTARPDTMPDYRQRMSDAARELIPQYSVLGAAAVFGDRRMLVSIYSPGAMLRLGDSTFTGGVRAAAALVDLFRRSSVNEMVRQSRSTNAIDSVYTDSGAYLMASKRGGGETALERGTFVSKWRKLAKDPGWALEYDEITPDPPATKR
ncbi:MAG: hypothetical protein O2973_02655 [Gemmatimonadetes bacterium]|nr:hypothetical protein [Gemmatimonadota bacterium]